MRPNKKRDIEWQERNIIRLLLNRAKHRALEKNIPFDLLEEDVLLPKQCPILGIDIVVIRGNGRRKNGPSLDRIDPTKGYTKNNVWIISDLANKMKQNATKEELVAFGKWTQTL